MTEEQKEMKPSLLLFAGVYRGLKDGKLYAEFHHLDENRNRTDQKALFEAKDKAIKKLNVGNIYQILNNGNQYRIGATVEWKGYWHDDAEREAMVAASRAERVLDDKVRMSKKVYDADTNLEHTLSALRVEYQKLITRTDRLAFELVVLEALRRP